MKNKPLEKTEDGSLERGTPLASWRVEKLLGKSNLSEVYLALDGAKNEPVVIKLVKSSGLGAAHFPSLQKEVEILQHLSHPHIVKFLSSFYDADHGMFGIVTEYIPGESLKEAIASQAPLDVSLAIRLVLQLLDALQYSHERNIIHCDLKPSNLILRGDLPQALDNPELRVIDYGLGKLLAQVNATQQVSALARGMAGTLPYMAPEQLDPTRMGGIDRRADLYSVGALLFELLTGSAPFDASDPGQLIKDKRSQTYPQMSRMRGDVPAVLTDIVDKLLSPNPDERYQSAVGLQEDLSRLYDLEEEKKAGREVQLGRHDARSSLWEAPPLVGREPELVQLSDFLDSVADGKGSLFFIGGSAGVGKTRLISEFSRTLYSRGGWLASGKCRDHQSHTPYYPLIECANELIACINGLGEEERKGLIERIKESLSDSISIVSNMLPPLQEILGEREEGSLSADQRGQRFLFAFWQMISAISDKERPFFFFLDDLQWADEGTLKWLEYVAMKLHNEPGVSFGLLATYRSEALDQEEANFARWHSELDSRLYQQILLGPLSLGAIETLINQFFRRLGGEPDPSTAQLVPFVQQRSKGNPFYICELIKSLLESKTVLLQAGKWSLDSEKLSTIPVSEDAVGLVLARLSQLPPEAQKTLHMGALLGTRFHLHDVMALGSSAEKEVVGAIKLAESLHLIVLDPLHSGAYQFAHDNIAQAFYQLEEEPSRRKFHARIGYYLERKEAFSSDEGIFSLAHHFSRSGELNKALHYLSQAGDVSAALYANRQALDYYTRALSLLQHEGDRLVKETKHRNRLIRHIEEHLGDLYVLLGEYQKGIESFTVAGEVATTRLEKARIERKTGLALFHSGALDTPVAHFEKSLEILGFRLPTNTIAVICSILTNLTRQLFPRKIRHLSLLRLLSRRKSRELQREIRLEVVRSCAVLTELFYFTQSLARSFQVHLTALNIAESMGDSRELAEIYLIHGFNCFMGGWFSRGLQYERMGRAIYEKIGDIAGVAKAYCYEGYDHMWAGNWDKGIEAARRSAALLETVGNLWQVEINYANWAFGHIHKGEFDRAISILRELRSIIESKKTDRGLIDYHNHIALAYCRKGYLEQATQHAKEAEKLCQESRQKFYLATTYTVFGEIDLLLEQFEEAENNFNRAVAIIRENQLVGDYAVWPYVAMAELEVRKYAAQREMAEEYRKLKAIDLKKSSYRALSMAKKFRNHRSRAERIFGAFYELTGEHEKAKTHYRLALEVAQKLGSLYDRALAHAAMGTLLVRENEKSSVGKEELLRAEELLKETSAAIEMAKVKRTLNYILPEREEAGKKGAHEETAPISRRGVEDRKIASVLQTCTVMNSVLKIDLLLEKIMDLACENFSAQRGFLILDEELLRIGQEKLAEINELGDAAYKALRSEFLSDREVFLKDPNYRRRLVVKVARNVERSSIKTEEFQLSRTVIQKVFDTGKAALIVDAIKDPELKTQKSVLLHQLRSIMCVPLRFIGNILGVIYLDNSFVSELFTKQDLQIMRYFSAQAVVAIENALVFRKLNIALGRLKEVQSQLVHTERISAIGQAVAKISHEINNPLTSISGYSKMLKQIIPPEQTTATQYCEIIHKEAQRCGKLVKDMLTFSKKGPVELKKIDLNRTIEECVRMTDFFKPARISVQFEKSELPPVIVDVGQIHQVFVNLITNAYQAMEQAATPQGTLLIVPSVEAPDQVAVRFTDNGPGMSAEVQKHLFEPFFTTKDKGTGLGLSIAHYIIQKHGGRLYCESAEGQGTSFIVSLPSAAEAEIESTGSSALQKAA